MVQKFAGSNVEIKTTGTGYGKVYINGHEIPGVLKIDTSKIMQPDELSCVTLTIHVSEFTCERMEGYEVKPQ